MEQFSLEKYLANPSRKLVTRDGRKARIICTDMKSTTYPVVALIENGSGYEQLTTLSKNGEYSVNESSVSDLFFAPEKHEGYINVYRSLDNANVYCGRIYNSEALAKNACIGSIATVKIKWEE